MRNHASIIWLAVPGLALGALVALAPGCGSDSNGASSSSSGGNKNGDGGEICNAFGCTTPSPDGGGAPGCTGLACNQITNCSAGSSTTVTGRVFDPAGKVPIYNVVVYVPNAPLAPITPGLGATCDRCDGSVSGEPIAITLTDANGDFKLENVPAETSFPLVMQIGKWRRTVTLPAVKSCTSAAADPTLTRLPKNHTEGDIPQIALTTGSADPLECLLRKIGLDDSEFGVAGSPARVHLYAGGSTAPATATSSFAAGGNFTAATTVWDSVDDLKKYDILMMSCEGGENPETKPPTARQALYDYASAGGRVFASHYHHYWFSNSPVPAVKNIASWTNDFTCTPVGSPQCPTTPEPATTTAIDATVNTSFPKGQAMHDWLKNVNALDGATPDTLPMYEARQNIDSVTSNALSWMTIHNPAANNVTAHEYVSFNAPVGADAASVCGRVVYTDLHVGSGTADAPKDKTGQPFPNGCTTPDLNEQQKALEFMLFDLSSCISKDDQAPEVPK